MSFSVRVPRGVLRGGFFGLMTRMGAEAGATPVAVNWVPANGAAVAGSTLFRKGGTGFSDTAVGSLAIISGPGQLEFSTTEADRAKAAGLGSRDNNESRSKA